MNGWGKAEAVIFAEGATNGKPRGEREHWRG